MTESAFAAAVHLAAHRLGPNAGAEAIEQEAFRLLDAGSRSDPSMGVSEVQSASLGRHASLSLSDCSSRRTATQRALVYDKVRSFGQQIQLLTRAGTSAPLTIHVRDIQDCLAGHPSDHLVELTAALEAAALDSGIDAIIGPFIDASFPEGLALLDVAEHVFDVCHRVQPIVQLGTAEQGFSHTSAMALSLALASHVHSRSSSGLTLHTVVCGCGRRALGHRAPSSKQLLLRSSNAVASLRREGPPGVSSLMADVTSGGTHPGAASPNALQRGQWRHHDFRKGEAPERLQELLQSALESAASAGSYACLTIQTS